MSGNWTLLWKYHELAASIYKNWKCHIVEEGANELGCTAPQMWNHNGLHGAGCPLDCGSFNMENIPTCRRTWGHLARLASVIASTHPIALIGGQCHLSCCLISACLFSLFDLHLHLSVASSQNWRFDQDVLWKILWRCFPSWCVPIWYVDIHFDRKHEGAICNNWIQLSYCSELLLWGGYSPFICKGF